jgi:hypothetical protein
MKSPEDSAPALGILFASAAQQDFETSDNGEQ